MSRIIVCGGRDFSDQSVVWNYLADFHSSSDGPIELLVHGAGGGRVMNRSWVGADLLADQWAKRNGVEVRSFVAQWKKHGAKAGPIRNSEMLKAAWPIDRVIAFPGGRGTLDMCRKAEAKSVPVTAVGWVWAGGVSRLPWAAP